MATEGLTQEIVSRYDSETLVQKFLETGIRIADMTLAGIHITGEAYNFMLLRNELVSRISSSVPVTRGDGALRSLADIEADVIRIAIKERKGHMSSVAKGLGIGRSTLYRKIDNPEYADLFDTQT